MVDEGFVFRLKEPHRLINPATDLVDGVLYFGVWARIEEEDGERETLVLVTSEREVINALEDEEMASRGLRLKYAPAFTSRWSLGSVNEWVNNGTTPPIDLPFEVLLPSLKKYIELQDERYYDFVVLWAMGTYLIAIFHSYPYLAISGLKRSGKTKLLCWLEQVCFNSVNSANISDPSIYRLVDCTRATILMDEASTLESRERKLDQKTMLYAGYKKGAKVYRAEKTGRGIIAPMPFSLFSPKAFVTFKGCEEILHDRAIEISMWRGKENRILDSEIKDEDPFWQGARDLLYVWAMTHFREVRENYERIRLSVDLPIHGRHLELWAPILAVAASISREEYERMLALAREVVSKSAMEDEEYREQKVIEALVILTKDWAEGEVREVSSASVKDLVHELLETQEDRKEMDTRAVSRILTRSFGFKSVRRGRKVLRLIPKASVLELARRYGVDVEQVLQDEERMVKGYLKQCLSAGERAWEVLSRNAFETYGSPHDRNFQLLSELSAEMGLSYLLKDKCTLEEDERAVDGRRRCSEFGVDCGVSNPKKCPLRRGWG